MHIGQSIRILRKNVKCTQGEPTTRVGVSQSEFASSVGITQSYLSGIENGHAKPSFDILEKIAKRIDVPLAVLFWFGVEEEDVGEGKIDFYQSLKPVIDKMIMSLFIDN